MTTPEALAVLASEVPPDVLQALARRLQESRGARGSRQVQLVLDFRAGELVHADVLPHPPIFSRTSVARGS